MQGEKLTLYRKQRTVLAAWIAMFVMVAEFMLDKTGIHVGVSDEQRRSLKDTCTAPKNWKIWIGNYTREKRKGYWVHNTVPILSEEHVPQRSDLGVDLPNTQSTTAVFGQLYIHAFSSAIRSIVRKQTIVGEGLRVLPLLWPIKQSHLLWPPPRPLTDREADGIATALSRRARGQPPARRPA
jgi:hypothetical protein